MSRRRSIVCALVVAASPLGVLGACNASPKLIAAGGECFQATDCEDGLVCVPQKAGSGARVCSNDLSRIQTTEEAGGGGNDAVAAADGDATTPPGEAAPPDDNVAPPDTAPPPDTGPPPPDAAD